MGFIKWATRTLGAIIVGLLGAGGLIASVTLGSMGRTTLALLTAIPSFIGILYVMYVGSDRDKLVNTE
jgi:hypothetical protein